MVFMVGRIVWAAAWHLGFPDSRNFSSEYNDNFSIGVRLLDNKEMGKIKKQTKKTRQKEGQNKIKKVCNISINVKYRKANFYV